jgi:hypothetical protein
MDDSTFDEEFPCDGLSNRTLQDWIQTQGFLLDIQDEYSPGAFFAPPVRRFQSA